MNLLKVLVASAIAAAPMASVMAQQPNNPCSALHWNAKFLEMFPRAAVACQDVVVKDGVKYAKFNAKVKKVVPDGVEIEVLNVAKTGVGTATWHTAADQVVNVGGKEEPAKELKKGDDLTFWVEEGSVKMDPSPGLKAMKGATK